MTSIMSEMIAEVAAKVAENGYAFARRTTEKGEIVLAGQIVNTQTKNNEFRRSWTLNGKRISAANLAAA